MNTGNLQRRWSETRPEVYDKEARVVRMDIVAERRAETMDTDSGQAEEKDGYSYIEVQIDSQIDYGHIKSQLIEAGFAQKDEFGLLMNAVDVLVNSIATSDSLQELKDCISTEEISAFRDFCEFRNMCAEAAETVIESYQI